MSPLTVFKSDPIYGSQLPGFLPCPCCGELPYIKVNDSSAFGETTMWAYVKCRHFYGDIHVSAQSTVRANRPEIVARYNALADAMRYWNTRAPK